MNFSLDHLAERYGQAGLGMHLYLAFLFWGVMCLINIGLVQLLWNVILPKIGPFGKITFLQALLLSLLVWLLVGGGFKILFTFAQ